MDSDSYMDYSFNDVIFFAFKREDYFVFSGTEPC